MSEDRRLLQDLVLAQSTTQRAGHLREDPEALAGLTDRLFVHVGPQGARIDGAALVWETIPCPDNAVTFLGVEGDTAFFACHHVASEEPDGWRDLRQIGSRLEARDVGLMVSAVALDNWRRSHAHCGRCGTQTWDADAGWARRCPECDHLHFPRTDPAVIVLVRDGDDRALLGRQAQWAEGWFSTLAGFVEAGETAEAAVVREVREESGVHITPDSVHYLGSQPWPFPSSLMLGYHAWTDDPSTDPDGEEIAEVRWLSRDELRSACQSGEVRLPPRISIARMLIERWFGEPIPSEWGRN
ncbi:MAG: NAD(+) diphosphatase [Actinobacteria bacterium]|nr:NAD(+) diphosphatase [Actinomycetota bacterium]